jgi:segregation and condensation protein B
VEQEKIQSIVESLLFLSGEPVMVARLAQASGASEEEVEQALADLMKTYGAPGRGLFLIRSGGEVQLATRPDNSIYLENMVKGALQDSLSKAAMEVLAVIAYRGPISRAEIEAVRGVNCSVTLRNLLMRELIERRDNPNDSRGYLYVISLQFLKELGLGDVTALPDYETLRKDERMEAVLAAKETEAEAGASQALSEESEKGPVAQEKEAGETEVS